MHENVSLGSVPNVTVGHRTCGFVECDDPLPPGRSKYCSKSHKIRQERRRRVGAIAAAQQGVCYLCFMALDVAAWNLDHIVPKSANGGGGVHNKAAAHQMCNQLKGDRQLEDVGGPSWFRSKFAQRQRKRFAEHMRAIIEREMQVAIREQMPKEGRSRVRALAKAVAGRPCPEQTQRDVQRVAIPNTRLRVSRAGGAPPPATRS